jgi:hypothetical protein
VSFVGCEHDVARCCAAHTTVFDDVGRAQRDAWPIWNLALATGRRCRRRGSHHLEQQRKRQQPPPSA